MVLSLGICHDPELVKLSGRYLLGEIKCGEWIFLPNKKAYTLKSSIADVYSENPLGNIRKRYELHPDGWHLHKRTVSNNRGTYSREVKTVEQNPVEIVSIAGNMFVKQPDGNYLQEVLGKQRIVLSSDIEEAINYIKGIGSVENYNKIIKD